MLELVVVVIDGFVTLFRFDHIVYIADGKRRYVVGTKIITDTYYTLLYECDDRIHYYSNVSIHKYSRHVENRVSSTPSESFARTRVCLSAVTVRILELQ